MVALKPSEYRLLEYVMKDKTKVQLDRCLAELTSLGTKKIMFEKALGKGNNPGLKQKLAEIDKSIERIKAGMGKMERPPEEIYRVLKSDFRIDNITADKYTMIITTKEVIIEQRDSGYLNYGRFRIYLNFKDCSYDMESLDGKKHPMMKGDHIHVCSHDVRLVKCLENGDFYGASMIMISLLFQEDLDFGRLVWL
jgi:hypothetical protein